MASPTESWTAPLTNYVYTLESKLDNHIGRNFTITTSISIILILTIVITFNNLKNVQKQLLQEISALKSKINDMDVVIHSNKLQIRTLEDDSNHNNSRLESYASKQSSIAEEISSLYPRIESSLDNRVDGKIEGVLMKLDAIKYEMSNKINHLDRYYHYRYCHNNNYHYHFN